MERAGTLVGIVADSVLQFKTSVSNAHILLAPCVRWPNGPALHARMHVLSTQGNTGGILSQEMGVGILGAQRTLESTCIDRCTVDMFIMHTSLVQKERG